MTAPNAVTDLAVTRVTQTTALVTWSLPTTGDDPTSVGYVLASTTPASTESVSLPADAVSAQLTGLIPGVEYRVTVTPSNSDGGVNPAAATFTTLEDTSMTILQADLTRIQVGIEATEGTPVAASMSVPYSDGSVTPTVERTLLEEHGTVMADTTDVITKRMTELSLTQNLDSETIIPALLCSLAQTAPGNPTPKVWSFEPKIDGPSVLSSATWEFAETDGAASPHSYQGQFSAARCTALGISASDAGVAQLTTTWMGRATKPLSAPAKAAEPARTVFAAGWFGVWIDDTWAKLGSTKWGTVRSVSVDIEPGLTQADALTARADLDPEYWRRDRIRGSMSLTVDHDERGTDELTHWADGDLRFVRVAVGNGAAGAAKRSIEIDFVGRYITSPDVLASSDGQMTLDLDLQLRADVSTSTARMLAVRVTNGLSSV